VAHLRSEQRPTDAKETLRLVQLGIPVHRRNAVPLT